MPRSAEQAGLEQRLLQPSSAALAGSQYLWLAFEPLPHAQDGTQKHSCTHWRSDQRPLTAVTPVRIRYALPALETSLVRDDRIAVMLQHLLDAGMRLKPAGASIQYDRFVAAPVRFYNGDGPETGAGILVFQLDAQQDCQPAGHRPLRMNG